MGEVRVDIYPKQQYYSLTDFVIGILMWKDATDPIRANNVSFIF